MWDIRQNILSRQQYRRVLARQPRINSRVCGGQLVISQAIFTRQIGKRVAVPGKYELRLPDHRLLGRFKRKVVSVDGIESGTFLCRGQLHRLRWRFFVALKQRAATKNHCCEQQSRNLAYLEIDDQFLAGTSVDAGCSRNPEFSQKTAADTNSIFFAGPKGDRPADLTGARPPALLQFIFPQRCRLLSGCREVAL